MVVEDNPDIREVLQLALSDRYSVTTACNGQEALDLLETHSPPDVMILDMMMPVLNGLEVLQRLRKHALWARIPVIVATASTGLRLEDFGTFGLLRKPFALDNLQRLIERAVEHRTG